MCSWVQESDQKRVVRMYLFCGLFPQGHTPLLRLCLGYAPFLFAVLVWYPGLAPKTSALRRFSLAVNVACGWPKRRCPTSKTPTAAAQTRLSVHVIFIPAGFFLRRGREFTLVWHATDITDGFPRACHHCGYSVQQPYYAV